MSKIKDSIFRLEQNKRFSCLERVHAGISRGEMKAFKESKKSIQSTFLCPVCGRMFYKKFVFDLHERKHVLEKNNLGCDTAAEGGDSVVQKHVTQTEQTISGFTQDRVEPGVSRTTSQKRRRKGSKVDSDANCDKKPFKCRVCGKGFAHSSNRSMHQKIHSDEKLFACSVCGKCFSQRRILVRHEKIHQGTDRVECDICGRTFSQRSSYNRHRRIHAMEDEFICRVCGKGFKQVRYLNEHEDRHAASTDEKVFSCQYCGRKFARRSGCAKHMKVHKKTSAGAGTVVARHEETDNEDFGRTENDDDVSANHGAGVNSESCKLLTVTMSNCVVAGEEVVVTIGQSSHLFGAEAISVIDGAVALGDGVTMDIDEVQQIMGVGEEAVAMRDEVVTMGNEPVTMGDKITDSGNLSLLVSEVEVVTMLDDLSAIM